MSTNELVEYYGGEGGPTLEAYVARPNAGGSPRPAVIVIHTWAGRTAFENNVADKLAALGYVGFAADVYGKGVVGKSMEENGKLAEPFFKDPHLLISRIKAAVQTVKGLGYVDSTQVAAVGYCFGGLGVLHMARAGVDVAGVVSIHGVYTPIPESPYSDPITTKILVLHGFDDPLAPPDKMVGLCEELTSRKADWQLVAYGNTGHAFTNPAAHATSNTRYVQSSDKRSWIAVTNFLLEIFHS